MQKCSEELSIMIHRALINIAKFLAGIQTRNLNILEPGMPFHMWWGRE
jgi:hypothetical protein